MWRAVSDRVCGLEWSGSWLADRVWRSDTAHRIVKEFDMAADLHSSVASSRVVVEAQRLFDGHRFIEPARVVIAGGVVVAVGADVVEPTTVDLGDVTLLR